MPIFPRYESKGSLTTQVPSVGAVQSTEAQQTESNAKIGQTIQENSVKWTNALDTVQKTTATANFKSGILDIQQRAESDPNYNNSDQYYKEIEKLKTENLKGFASKTAETEMAINFGYESKVAGIQVANIYKKKLIDVGQASTLQLINSEVNNPNEHSLASIQSLLNTQVSAGIIGHKEAYKLMEKANEDLGVNRISQDLNQAQTPDEVAAVKQGITSGAYEVGGVTIAPKQKEALLNIAERAEKNSLIKLQAQATEAIAQNRASVILGVASGQLNPETMDITAITNHDPKLGTALTKVKEFMTNYNPKLPLDQQRVSMSGVATPSEMERATSYAKSVKEVFANNNNEQLGNFIIQQLETKGDGTNQSIKLAAFMKLAALKMKANNPQTPEDMKALEQVGALSAGVSFLQSSNAYLSPQAIGDFLVKNYHSGAVSKKEVMQEARTALEDLIFDRYKTVTKLASLPNKIVDGEASVEDLHSGSNELSSGNISSDYSDAD